MTTDTWSTLSPDAKADNLRQEFDAAWETERKHLVARSGRHNALERRVAVLEKALKQISLRVGFLEGKN